MTWEKLTDVYIELGMYESVSGGKTIDSVYTTPAVANPRHTHNSQALLTLNSCPMFTFNERDLHRMPTPSRTHLPIKPFIAASNILDEDSAKDNEVGMGI